MSSTTLAVRPVRHSCFASSSVFCKNYTLLIESNTGGGKWDLGTCAQGVPAPVGELLSRRHVGGWQDGAGHKGALQDYLPRLIKFGALRGAIPALHVQGDPANCTFLSQAPPPIAAVHALVTLPRDSAA